MKVNARRVLSLHRASCARGIRGFALLLLASLAGTACDVEQPAPPQRGQPNVLLVVLDTVRRDHLSTYGYARQTSPNLDALAAQGTRYDDVVSPAAWTIPSHATLMTGLPPAVHGAHHEHPALDEHVPTLAEMLRDAGYRTAGFSANPFVGRPSRLDRGFETFERIDTGGRAVNLAALGFMAATPEPWFVFLNYMEAHMPYSGLPEDVRLRFMPGTPESIRFSSLEAQTDAHLYACGEKAPSPELLSTLVDLYDAALAHLDAIIGELIAGLEPFEDRTVVIVVSDHGELLGEHGRVEHQWTLLEPLLRVPLIVRAPGRVDPGSVVDTPIGLADVHGLVLELAGLSPPSAPREPGERLAEYHRPLRLLKGVGQLAPECASRIDRRLITVNDGRYKLEWTSTAAPRLFDLEADPGELHDVASLHPDRVERMSLSAARRRALAATGEDAGTVPELDRDERARLKALGYLPGPAEAEAGAAAAETE